VDQIKLFLNVLLIIVQKRKKSIALEREKIFSRVSPYALKATDAQRAVAVSGIPVNKKSNFSIYVLAAIVVGQAPFEQTIYSRLRRFLLYL